MSPCLLLLWLDRAGIFIKKVMLSTIILVYGSLFSLILVQHLLFICGLSFKKGLLQLMAVTLPVIGVVCLTFLTPFLVIDFFNNGRPSWMKSGFSIFRAVGLVLLVLAPMFLFVISPVYRGAVYQSSCIELDLMSQNAVFVISNPTGSEWHLDKYRSINKYIRTNKAFESNTLSDSEYRRLTFK